MYATICKKYILRLSRLYPTTPHPRQGGQAARRRRQAVHHLISLSPEDGTLRNPVRNSHTRVLESRSPRVSRDREGKTKIVNPSGEEGMYKYMTSIHVPRRPRVASTSTTLRRMYTKELGLAHETVTRNMDNRARGRHEAPRGTAPPAHSSAPDLARAQPPRLRPARR